MLYGSTSSQHAVSSLGRRRGSATLVIETLTISGRIDARNSRWRFEPALPLLVGFRPWRLRFLGEDVVAQPLQGGGLFSYHVGTTHQFAQGVVGLRFVRVKNVRLFFVVCSLFSTLLDSFPVGNGGA